MNHAIRISLLLSISVAASLPLLAQTQPAGSQPLPDIGGPDAVWRDGSKTVDQRARDLLGRLTLQEKVGLLHADGTFTSPGLARFGIGKMWMSDGPQGVREEIQASGWNPANWDNDFATAMPADVCLAATWDPELGKAFGNVIGEEAGMRKKNIMLCPGMNIMRTPLNGRNSEYLGEDPYLASRMVVGFVNGAQQNGVAACAKHYALNNQETNRSGVNVKVDERTIREIYLPAFKAAITEGHAWAVMAAYNRVNGQYCSENDFLLNQVLKKDWGFQGLVMTDWGGAHSTVNAINNGLDLEMGSNVTGNHNNDYLGAPLLRELAAAEPRVAMSRVDDAALRNLRVMIATGLADTRKQTKVRPQAALLSPEHLAAARSVVESGCVLLKNEGGVLPVDAGKVKTIAVIGDIAQQLFAPNGDSARIKTKNEMSILAGIQKRAGEGIKVNFVQGYAAPAAGRGGFGGGFGRGGPAASAPATNAGAANPLIDAAVAAAKEADVVIVAAGLYRAQDQEGRDRPNMDLPAAQNDLIKAVAKANPKTVVVMTGGSPSVVSPWIKDIGGMVMYWYGGTEGGNGLARVLFGDVNPSGHLPCTWPKQLADSPAHAGGDTAQYPGTGGGRGGFGGGPGGGAAGGGGPDETYGEGVLVGYRWFDAKKIEPEFPFGFGLSYSTFQLSGLDLQPSPAFIAANLKQPVVSVSVTVANTGPRDAAQVVQVYIEPEKSGLPRPPRELKGFAKVTVAKGQRTSVNIRLDLAAFAYFDPDKHAWMADAGDYTILVGDSSRNLPLKAIYKLTESMTIKEGP